MPLDARVNYYVGEWTRPRIPKSKLFVFKSLHAACRFRLDMENDRMDMDFTIFEVECVNPEQVPFISWVSRILEFWSQEKRTILRQILNLKLDRQKAKKEARDRGFKIIESINDTYWCDRVKLIKEISREEACY